MDGTTYAKIFTRGTQASLDSTTTVVPIVDGTIRLTTDSQRLFIDQSASRIEITDFVKGLTAQQILGTNSPLDKIYLASDTFVLYYYNKLTSEWINLTTASLGALAMKTSVTINEIDEIDGLDFGDEDITSEVTVIDA